MSDISSIVLDLCRGHDDRGNGELRGRDSSEGRWLVDDRFEDDQGTVSSSEDGLQRLMDRLNETANRFNMKINVQKIKTMVVSRDEGQVVNITIDGQRAEQIKNF